MQRLFPNNRLVPATYGSGLRLVVAEAPGQQEAQEGTQLVGGAGRWFDSMCRKAGVRRQDLSFINTINCRPPGNLYPTSAAARRSESVQPDESWTGLEEWTRGPYISPEDATAAVSHCLHAHVEPVLKARPWVRVDVLGDQALRQLCGKHEGITKWRGSPLPIPLLGERPVALPTIHPSAIARNQELLPAVINDLNKSLQVPPENYILFPTMDEVRAFTAKEFALDIETNGWTKEITMVGLSDKPYHALVVPFSGEYKDELRRIICDAEAIITQNGLQFDIPILFEALGIEWQPQ